MTQAPDLPRLLDIMARLRDPERGCPWDREQTFATIAPYTIEEAYEVAEACERGDPTALKDELGDLLLQVVFHARMAEESGLFAFNDVAKAISDKMLHRHPHVFADGAVADAREQTAAWEEIKAAERRAKAAEANKSESALDGIGEIFPALTRAIKLQRRAARVGFDWATPLLVLDKIEEEVGELHEVLGSGGDPERLADEVGDLLFAVVNLARKVEADPEQALRRACRKFDRRFRRVEELLAAKGTSATHATLQEMEVQWETAKAEERGQAADAKITPK